MRDWSFPRQFDTWPSHELETLAGEFRACAGRLGGRKCADWLLECANECDRELAARRATPARITVDGRGLHSVGDFQADEHGEDTVAA